jgi:hypothetical protein
MPLAVRTRPLVIVHEEYGPDLFLEGVYAYPAEQGAYVLRADVDPRADGVRTSVYWVPNAAPMPADRTGAFRWGSSQEQAVLADHAETVADGERMLPQHTMPGGPETHGIFAVRVALAALGIVDAGEVIRPPRMPW